MKKVKGIIANLGIIISDRHGCGQCGSLVKVFDYRTFLQVRKREAGVEVEGQHISLVRSGATAISQWRHDNPDSTISAAHIVASDIDLSGANLASANFAGGQFLRCNLSHVSFVRANLSQVQFDECTLNEVDFRGANMKGVVIGAKSLDGARLGGNGSIARMAGLQIFNKVSKPIVLDRSKISWYNSWISWDKLRFLSTIRIFVPAYVSLVLTVIYLNFISWYNSINEKLIVSFANLAELKGAQILSDQFLSDIEPTYTHALILCNFMCLAIAATCFLRCPARVVEFSRERWVSELEQPEILYDYAAWRGLAVRVVCASSLIIGGLLSIFLLGRGIVQQVRFILQNVG